MTIFTATAAFKNGALSTHPSHRCDPQYFARRALCGNAPLRPIEKSFVSRAVVQKRN